MRVYGDKGTVIWISKDNTDNYLKPLETYGDVCLKVKLPKESYHIGPDEYFGDFY